MSLMGAVGSSFPSNFTWLDWKVPSFTVAAATSGSPYSIPGTTKILSVNPIINQAVGAGGINLLDMGGSQYPLGSAYYKITTNTTDNTSISIDYSLDAGSTWSAWTTNNIAGNNQNVSFTWNGVGGSAIGTTTPATNNQVHLRLSIRDATDPTTDTFTITNLRVTLGVWVLK